MSADLLLVVGERIAPGIRHLDAAGREQVAAIIGRAIASRPPALRRQLAAFLGILRWAPVVRYGRRFDHLAAAQQDAVLRWLQDARSAKLRHGFWGVKTLVYMGYFGRPEVGEAIGYHPSRSGNSFLHAR